MLEKAGDQVGFVFIHGAGLSSGIWTQVAEGMGHPCLLVDYPQRHDGNQSRRGCALQDYTACMNKQIETWPFRRIILVAHSLGGLLALQTAEAWRDRVVGFAAIGAVIPARGGSFLSAMPFPKRLLLGAVLRFAGTKPPEGAIRQGLCSDLTLEQTESVIRGFVAESVRVYTDRIEAPAPEVPKLYVKLGQDRELSLAMQERMAANLDTHYIEQLETGHLPMLSKPDEVRRVLNDFMHRIREGG